MVRFGGWILTYVDVLVLNTYFIWTLRINYVHGRNVASAFTFYRICICVNGVSTLSVFTRASNTRVGLQGFFCLLLLCVLWYRYSLLILTQRIAEGLLASDCIHIELFWRALGTRSTWGLFIVLDRFEVHIKGGLLRKTGLSERSHSCYSWALTFATHTTLSALRTKAAFLISHWDAPCQFCLLFFHSYMI